VASWYLSRVNRTRSAPFLIIIGSACAALLGLSLLLPSASLVSWFRLPARPADFAFYAQGASLLRVMLAIVAGVLVAWAITMVRATPAARRSPDPLALQSPRGMTRFELGALTIVVILGVLLRLSRMGESLWYDEIAAWIGYGVHGPGAIVGNFADPSNHVLHTLLTSMSVTVTEEFLSSEVSLRLPAFLASVASIAVVYALGRRTLGGGVALLASVLMAIWPVCVLEGAEARGYSMMMLFSALMSLQLLIAMEKQRPLPWLLYALWCALGAWAHMVTVFVAFGHGAWLAWLMCSRRHFLRALPGFVSLILAAAMTLVMYAPVIPEMLDRSGIVKAESVNQPGLLGVEGWHLLLQLGGSWWWPTALPGLALFVIGAWVIWRTSDRLARATSVITLAGLPIFLVLVVLLDTWVYARFALFAMPGAALVAAIGWNRLWQRAVWAAIVLGALLVAGSVLDLASRPARQPLREAEEYIFEHGGEGSRVLLVSIAHDVLYAAPLDVRTSYRLGETLEADLAQSNPQWVVVLYPDRLDAAHFELLEQRGFTQRARFDGWVDWGQGDVLVFMHDSEDAAR
jgi:hypothetical protein